MTGCVTVLRIVTVTRDRTDTMTDGGNGSGGLSGKRRHRRLNVRHLAQTTQL